MNTTAARNGTREEIQRVALELFSERGYDAVSMREISERLGITKAALYYHFEGKADIVRSLLASYNEQLAALIAWAEGQPRTYDTRRELLKRWVELVRTDGADVIRFLGANQHVMREVKHDSSMRERFRTIFGLFVEADAPLRDQLRARIAGMSVHVAVMTSQDLGVSLDEVLDLTEEIALELLAQSTDRGKTVA